MNKKFKNVKVNPVRIGHAIRRSLISIIALILIIILINLAPNYVKEGKNSSTKVIINNNNITKSLKNPVINEDGKYYLSTDDIKNFFDEYLINDENKVITTSATKTAKITTDSDKMYLNGSNVDGDRILTQDGKMYISINDMAKIYNLEYKINEDRNNIIISSLSRKLVQAESKKNQHVKYIATSFSRDLEKIKKGEKVYIVQENGEDVRIKDWIKVRTEDGVIGYLKEKNLINKKTIRDDLKYGGIEGKVSLVWDYYTQYNSAPNRTEKIDGINAVSPSFYELKQNGTIAKNIDEDSRKYIEWAHSNNYKVWPTLSNSYRESINRK